ncbi:HD domain-containing phosphohydrolase [Rariglobus hedericola]|uniref:Response regulator n=1 Tax=Rariglobus hedericola TaxID=2597822 RepID=A0A556QPT9_9BACT|nr:HD domain-containing phosphohydrolase [Rariglobus hedericola]TSJ78664.1 response regulator [Rariglobus hedericola]
MNPSGDPHSPRILVVDDEAIVLGALKETLERDGHRVTATTSPIRALEMLRDQDFAVILSDHRMPEMMGLDFLIESRKIRPNASRILITAVLSLPTIVEAINKGEIFRFVAKPWLREELAATIRNAFQRHHLVSENERLSAQTQELNSRLMVANASLARQVKDLEKQKSALDAANQDLATSYDHSLDLCSRILATYDPYLGGQTKAVVEIAQCMADTNHFTDGERHALRTGAWLCDLGLIGIPRELLRAFRTHPSRLTERERESIQTHPIYSQTLASYVDTNPLVAETIRAHHERFDGTGFPDALRAQSIPWPARCLAVAVCFVESGLAKEKAIEAILAESGKAFDPEAVRLFLKVTHLVQLPRQVHEIMLEELQPGMVLANGLYSPHGLLLVGEGQTLSASTIAKIRNHNLISAISQRLLVYS